MDQFFELFKNYALAMPTSVLAVIVLIVGVKLKKLAFKLIGLALIVAALLLFLANGAPTA